MIRKRTFLVAVSLLAGLVSTTGFMPTASAQTVPNLPEAKQGLSTLLGDVSDILSLGLPIGPRLYVNVDGSVPATLASGTPETVNFTGVTVNCSGLFLPIKGLDGPIELTVTVTQSRPSAGGTGVTTIGRRVTQPKCDGKDWKPQRFVSVTGGALGYFGAGTAIVQADLYACDLTGCNRWTHAAIVTIQ